MHDKYDVQEVYTNKDYEPYSISRDEQIAQLLLENNISFLSNFSTRSKFADLAGFIVFNEKNQECFSFGKHKGKLVLDILKTDSGYFNWLLNADFPLYTKNTLKSIKLKLLNNKLS